MRSTIPFLHSYGTHTIGSCQLIVMKELDCSQVACHVNHSQVVICCGERLHELRITGVFLIFTVYAPL